jgi:hypothetical protein
MTAFAAKRRPERWPGGRVAGSPGLPPDQPCAAFASRLRRCRIGSV